MPATVATAELDRGDYLVDDAGRLYCVMGGEHDGGLLLEDARDGSLQVIPAEVVRLMRLVRRARERA